MKKLMIAGAAALCATVGFSDVEGANIVGYASNELDGWWGNILLTPQFTSVGEDNTIRLGDLVPTAAGGYVLAATDNIDAQLLDDEGCTQDDFWYQWNGTKWVYFKTAGGHQKGDDASEEIVYAGQGFSFGNGVGQKAVVTLRSSGQVKMTDIVRQLDDWWGNVAIGNGFPTAVTFGDLSVEPRTAYVVQSTDNIDAQLLDDEGCTQDELWYQYNGTKWVYFKTAGDHQKGDDASSVQILPGQALSFGNGIGQKAIVDLRIPVPTSLKPEEE